MTLPTRKRSLRKSGASKDTGAAASKRFKTEFTKIKELTKDLELDLQALQKQIDCLCFENHSPGARLREIADLFDKSKSRTTK